MLIGYVIISTGCILFHNSNYAQESYKFYYKCVSQDLCERHEKGVLNDHQRALQKLGQYKKRKMSATVQGPSEV